MPAFTVIDHTELGASASSYDVTSISASYDHLYLEASVRSDQAASYQDFCHFQFNNDTTASNYSSTWLTASTVGSSAPISNRSTTYTWGGFINGPSALADTFSPVTMWIPNYANTANFKQVLFQSAGPNNSTTNDEWHVGMAASLWQSTAAIDQFTWLPYGGSDNFVQYSTFTLYGVTGA